MVVKMKPMCDCGHMFDNLAIDVGPGLIPSYTISPSHCPKCHEKIDCVKFQVPSNDGNGRFEYADEKYYRVVEGGGRLK